MNTLWGAAIACVLFAPMAVSAQNYPTKPIRLIIPFVPAGPTDNQARWAAQHLSTALGQPILSDNRPGAGGVPGTDMVAKAPPDGYTLLAGNPGPLTIAPTVRTHLPYDTLRDLHPIVLIAKSASCLCSHPSVPARGIQDLIKIAKARPGQLNYGTPGVGTVGHLATELFATEAGIKLNHVPYKGAAQYTVDLIAGNIELAINQFAIAAPLVKEGKVRCLGVTSRQRTPLLPDAPTIAEQGLKGYESYNWNGLLAPAGTPRAIVERIHEIVAKALTTPQAKEYFVNNQGHELGNLNPDEYAAFIKAETQKWARVAAKAGIPKQP